MKFSIALLFLLIFNLTFSQLPVKQDSLKAKENKFFLGINFSKPVYKLEKEGSIVNRSSYHDNFSEYSPKDRFLKSTGIGLNAGLGRKRFQFLAEFQLSQTDITFKGTSGTGSLTYYKTGANLYDYYDVNYASRRTDLLFSINAGYRFLEDKLIHLTPSVGLYYQDVLTNKVLSDSYTHYSSALVYMNNPYYPSNVQTETSGKATEFISIEDDWSRFGAKLSLCFSAIVFSKIELKMSHSYFFITSNYVQAGDRLDRSFYQLDLGLAYYFSKRR